MKLDDVLEIEIQDLDYEARGIGRIDNAVFFVENALPGEIVQARITKVEKRFFLASTTKVIKKSPSRVEPQCKHYAVCGGCDLMHLERKEEIAFKRDLVQNTLSHVGGINCSVLDTAFSKEFRYRNKIEVKIRKEGKRVVAGFFQKKSNSPFDIEDCLLTPKVYIDIVNEIKNLANDGAFLVYDGASGDVHQIVIRGNSKEELMVILVSRRNLSNISYIGDVLRKRFSNIKSFILNINENIVGPVLGPTSKIIFGESYICDHLLDVDLHISGESFYQVNHDMCERLYSIAIESGLIKDTDTVIDAYSGIGSISLNVSKKASFVYGIEIVPEAVDDAKGNMVLNNISNAKFICGPCENKISELVKDRKIDLIIFDPPRKGCDRKFIDTVIDAMIERVVYISCNVRTLARDLAIFMESGYEVKKVIPVDMFPRTKHVESVCLLELMYNI